MVLIDDEALASAIIELLRDMGWETWEVESFRAAREAIEHYQPGVFLVDPGLHVDLLERFIGRSDDGPSIVVLSDLSSVATIASHHHVTFVREPFELEDLARAVEAARHGTPTARAARG